MVELKVSNSTAELGTLDVVEQENFPVAITYQAAGLQVLDKRFHNWSKEFLVPASLENQQILQAVSDTRKNVLDEYTGVLYFDGTEVLRGRMRVTEVEIPGRPMYYGIKMFGSNADWLARCEGFALSDIAWGSVTYTTANIESTWQDYEDFNVDVTWPIINYGQFTGINSAGQGFVKLEDILPAIRITRAISEMFDQAGYTVVSDFLDGNGIIDARRFTMPLTGQNFKTPEQFADDAEFFAITDGSDQSNTGEEYTDLDVALDFTTLLPDFTYAEHLEFTDDTTPSANYTPVPSQFTGFAGKARFSFHGSLNYKGTGTKTTFLWVAIVKETLAGAVTMLKFKQQQVKLLVNNYHAANVLSYDLNTGFVTLSATDKVYVVAFIQRANTIGTSTNIDILLLNDSSFENEVSTVIVRGQTINYANVMPEIDCLDLLLGLKLPCNLYFAADVPQRKVYIEPRDAFFYSYTEALDWTLKLDKSTVRIEFPDDLTRTQILGYQEDGNDGDVKAYNETAEDLLNRVDYRLGDGAYVLSNRFKVGETRVVSDTFAATNFINTDSEHFTVGLSTLKGPNAGRLPTIARMWQEPGGADQPPGISFDFLPRLLWYIYDENGGKMRWDDGTGLNFVLEDNIATAHFGKDRLALSLGFPQLEFKNGQDINEAKVSGLLETFYSNHFRTLEKGTYLVAKFNLTVNDISQLDLRRQIYLEEPSEIAGYWGIEEVSDFQKSGLTTVRLVKLEPFDPIDLDFSNTSIKDVVTGKGKSVKISRGDPQASDLGFAGKMSGSGLVGNGGNGVGHKLQVGPGMTVIGVGNKLIDGDLVQIGGGDGTGEGRRNPYRVTSDGEPVNFGGSVVIETSGVLQQVYVTNDDGSLSKVYLGDG